MPCPALAWAFFYSPLVWLFPVSYILDALKKSERERSLGNVPTLGSTDQNQGRKVPLRWFVITVAVLVATLIFAWGWALYSRPLDGDSRARVEDMRQPLPAIEAEEVQAQRPALQQSAFTVDSGEERTVPKALPVPVTDLEPAVQSRLPKLSINVLSYSNDKSRRFVMIDQNIYKEGEGIAGGIVVEEIRKSDVIFSFGATQFILKP